MSLLSDIPTLMKWLAPYRGQYAIGLTALFGVNLADVLAPVFMAVAVDLVEAELRGVVPGTPPALSYLGIASSDVTILGAIGIYLGLQLMANVLRYPMLMKVAAPSNLIGQDLRNRIVDHVLRLSQSFYDHAKSGDLMSRATNDVGAARMMFGPSVLVGGDSVMIVTLVLAVMLALSWQLTLIAMIPLPLIVFATNRIAHAEYDRFEDVQQDLSKLTERSRESYVGIRIIQGYAREHYDQERFRAFSWRHRLKNLRLAEVQAVRDPTFDLMLGASTVLVLVFGGTDVVRGSMTTGTFLAFLFLVRFLSGPMIGLGWAVSLFQRGRASLGRIEALLAQPVRVVDAPDARVGSGGGDVELRDLTFSYSDSPTEAGAALEHVSLKVPEGTRLGIMGPVGSGKSTLVGLMLRLYEPPPGTVFVGGEDVLELTLESLRKQVVLAPQDTFLFSSTVERNITLGGGQASHSPATLAALAHLDVEIEELPDGYQSLLGERGINLSGGQRQRLAIARAIGADPRVLILDDCLSAVDAQTEERILHSLEDVFAGRTGIIISHRVCALRRCQQIVVLEKGRIVESGSHDELVRAGGYYAATAAAQTEGEGA
jgi:ATP-binding cassette subfamily B protein